MSSTRKTPNYDLSISALDSTTEDLSIKDQAPLSASSVAASASSVESSEGKAPSFTESAPPSETSAERNGGSKSSSRVSSAEYGPASSQTFDSEEEDSVISGFEVDGHKFEYRKISPALIPDGWSNNPNDLEPVSRSFPAEEYGLQPFVLPILASERNEKANRCLFSIFERFYLWTPASSELRFVTQSYKLRGILQRIHGSSFDLKTKPLETLSSWHSQHQITHLPLWFWQVPWGWSRDMKEFGEVMEDMDLYEYGLPLPIPILVSDGRNGGPEYFMKCGDRYYIYHEVAGFLYRVEEPVELGQILRALGRKECDGLRLTDCDVAPEYGGPNIVPDEEVPTGWTNQINEDAYDEEVLRQHGISIPTMLLFCDGGRGLPALYLFRTGGSRFYIWNVDSGEVSRIVGPEALQDILDALERSFEELVLSMVEPQC